MQQGNTMLTVFVKFREKSTYPISDYIRVAAMFVVVFLTVFVIKIGSIFSPDHGGVRAVENIQLAENKIYLNEDIEMIKELSS